MLSLRIALRYFGTRKWHAAVNVISAVSVAGVAVATAAIVVVLSVFNGFTDLAASHLAVIDPELRVVPVTGKVLPTDADSLARRLMALPEVEIATPVLEERALLVGGTMGSSDGSRQMPVRLKGVSPRDYARTVDFNHTVIDGVGWGPESVEGLQMSVGVAMETGLRPSPYARATIYVPRRRGRINPANPAGAYNGRELSIEGVFRVEQPEYDADRVIIPLETARELLERGEGDASALELRLATGADARAVAKTLRGILGPEMKVLDRLEQQSDAFRMIAVEKWMTFMMLVAILIIAAFNIISTLSLLVLEKSPDAVTLRALGAPANLVRGIFIWEGALITLAGGAIGLVTGALLSWGQQCFGWVKLGGDPSLLTTAVYPVRVAPWPDFVLVAVAVIGLSALIGACAVLFTGPVTKPQTTINEE